MDRSPGHPGERSTDAPTACLFVFLPAQVTGGSPAAILLLSPLLLLLAQDPLLLRWLEDRRRYLPPLAAVTAYLAGGALWQVRRVRGGKGGRSWGVAAVSSPSPPRPSSLAATIRRGM